MAMTFRPLAQRDLEVLSEWLARPHVAMWWREPADSDTVAATYGPMIDGSDPTEGFIVSLEGRSFGFIQRYRFVDNPEWQVAVQAGIGVMDAAGIDYLIGDETMIGRGLGRRMIAQFVDDSWSRYPEITAIVVAVQQANPPSWRALERVGFRRVWEGTLASDDPSDQGLSYLYRKDRPED
jgi:aminoglycoside 6'-N-acetyltransferase